MKFFTFIFFCTFFSSFCLAQENYEYVGVIKLNDSSFISLSLKIEENNGKISGYTLTDAGGEHETKTSIVGSYSEKDNILKFKEIETIYTKSYITEEDFCYINFVSDKYRLGKSNKLKGDFKGLFPDNTVCFNGEILLSTIEKYTQRVEKADKIIKRTKRIPDSLKETIDIVKTMKDSQMNILRNKQTMSVFSKSKNIRVEIFDGGQLDGDRITLKFNNKIVLDNYETNKERKSLPFTLNNKKSTFILTAENVGTMSTNTAVIEIFVDNSKFRALTNLKAGEQTQIDFYLK